MDGVLSRTPRGRPRVAAVGAILALCLVGAPLMSLFPVGLWDKAQALMLSGAELGIMLLAPVAAGGILLMFLLAMVWLRSAGVHHPTSSAALVTGTSMATPVILAYLAPAFTPFPGGTVPNIAVVSALVAAAAMGACVLAGLSPGRWRPGVLPGVAVGAAALLVLPLASEQMRDRSEEQRSLTQINGFEHTIAVVDHPDWDPVRVHEVHGGLRMTYTLAAPDAEATSGPGVTASGARPAQATSVHVLSWSQGRAAEGIHSGCGFPSVRCVDADGLVIVHRGGDSGPHDGRPREVRTRVGDGTVASVLPAEASPADQLLTVARALRAERHGERHALAQTVLQD